MNENIVELLLYLFENYLYENKDTDLNDKSIQNGLHQAGFATLTINNAFSWLEELQNDIQSYQNMKIQNESFRVFTDSENLRIDEECQDFILYLNNSNILSNVQREILINAIMKLEINQFDVDDLQWLTPERLLNSYIIPAVK